MSGLDEDETGRSTVVHCPEEPPEVSPAAAGALLRLLLAVAESDARSAPGRDRAA
jgi:hypothetical protein